MRKNNFLPGIILILVGLYFLLQQLNISFPFSETLFTWPMILIAIGIVQAYQGFSNRDDNKMFSGIILLGLGILFHGAHTAYWWGYHWGYFTLIVSIAFFMKHFVNKREGIVPGFILLLISLFALYANQFMTWMRSIFSGFESLWPILLIGVGIYLLFFRKR